MTADEFYAWASRQGNDGKLYELEEGKVVEMPPASEYHGALCAFIVHLLWKYVLRRGKGYVCSNLQPSGDLTSCCSMKTAL
jgi:Uma2 family endonuclease